MSKEKIYDLLAQMSVVYGKEETMERLQYYSIELEVYGIDIVSSALRAHIKTKSFFPALSEIIDAIAKIKCPQIDATHSAQLLIDSTYRFGEYRPEDAEKNLGPQLWSIVQRWGGWIRLCKFSDDQIPTVRAQLRDLIEGINRSSKFQIATNSIQQIGNEKKNLLLIL